MINKLILVFFCLVVSGCNLFESVESKQITECTENIKQGLNDPNSFEIISKSFVNRPEDGTRYLLIIEFTFKNSFGGRVRKSETCAFKTPNDVVLDKNDFQNRMREMKKNFEAAGIPF